MRLLSDRSYDQLQSIHRIQGESATEVYVGAKHNTAEPGSLDTCQLRQARVLSQNNNAMTDMEPLAFCSSSCTMTCTMFDYKGFFVCSQPGLHIQQQHSCLV